jgi:hypothetical protein
MTDDPATWLGPSPEQRAIDEWLDEWCDKRHGPSKRPRWKLRREAPMPEGRGDDEYLFGGS